MSPAEAAQIRTANSTAAGMTAAMNYNRSDEYRKYFTTSLSHTSTFTNENATSDADVVLEFELPWKDYWRFVQKYGKPNQASGAYGIADLRTGPPGAAAHRTGRQLPDAAGRRHGQGGEDPPQHRHRARQRQGVQLDDHGRAGGARGGGDAGATDQRRMPYGPGGRPSTPWSGSRWLPCASGRPRPPRPSCTPRPRRRRTRRPGAERPGVGHLDGSAPAFVRNYGSEHDGNVGLVHVGPLPAGVVRGLHDQVMRALGISGPMADDHPVLVQLRGPAQRGGTGAGAAVSAQQRWTPSPWPSTAGSARSMSGSRCAIRSARSATARTASGPRAPRGAARDGSQESSDTVGSGTVRTIPVGWSGTFPIAAAGRCGRSTSRCPCL